MRGVGLPHLLSIARRLLSLGRKWPLNVSRLRSLALIKGCRESPYFVFSCEPQTE